MINIRAVLNDLGVPYWDVGKNVSHGWVTISCPFCGDRSNHGGFSPNGKGYSCFKCGPHRIKETLLHYGPNETVRALLKQHSNALNTDHYNYNVTKERSAQVTWPHVTFEKDIPSVFSQYLHKRGYITSQIEQLYGVKACYITGDFKYRLVIPVVEKGRIVTYVGRDITEKSKLKYKNLKEELSVKPAKECVYNIDAVGDTAIVAEGIFDVWRLKYNAVAMLGLVFTRKQVRMLAEKLKKAFICFDNEPVAKESAMALGEELSMAGVDVYVVLIDKKDPDCLSESEAEELRKIISTY
jgi:DNA primase